MTNSHTVTIWFVLKKTVTRFFPLVSDKKYCLGIIIKKIQKINFLAFIKYQGKVFFFIIIFFLVPCNRLEQGSS